MTNAEIEAFLAVCETKNISKAAERLFISQSSLSTKIKTLEREVGCVLLVRGKGQRALTLTAAGEKLHALAKQHQEIVRQMLSVGRTAPEKLRVSSLNSVGTYLMTPIYERFMQRSGGTVLEIQDLSTEQAYASLEQHLTDLAFTASCRQLRRTASAVFSEQMLFVCAESSLYPDTVRLAELDPQREIYIDWFEEFVEWHQTAFGPDALPQVKLEIMSQLRYFLRKAENWAIVPASVAHCLMEDGAIVCRGTAFEVPQRVTYCLHLPDTFEKPAAVCFLDCVRGVLENMRERGIPIQMADMFFEQYAKT